MATILLGTSLLSGCFNFGGDDGASPTSPDGGDDYDYDNNGIIIVDGAADGTPMGTIPIASLQWKATGSSDGQGSRVFIVKTDITLGKRMLFLVRYNAIDSEEGGVVAILAGDNASSDVAFPEGVNTVFLVGYKHLLDVKDLKSGTVYALNRVVDGDDDPNNDKKIRVGKGFSIENSPYEVDPEKNTVSSQ